MLVNDKQLKNAIRDFCTLVEQWNKTNCCYYQDDTNVC